MEKIRKHMVFYGEVQGVGFRWNAKYIARNYGLSGWVRNLHDGSVELEAEGTPQDINSLVSELKSARFLYIERIDEKTVPLEGDYSFEVRY